MRYARLWRLLAVCEQPWGQEVRDLGYRFSSALDAEVAADNERRPGVDIVVEPYRAVQPLKDYEPMPLFQRMPLFHRG